MGPLGGGQPRVEGGIVVGVEARDGLARRGIGRGDHASSPTTATAKSVVPSGPPTSRVRCAGSPRMASTAASIRAAASRSRSEEHTSELQSLMRISYAVFCLKKKNNSNEHT